MMQSEENKWRVVVVGGHTRNIGKTQLVCDIIRAFPEVAWIAGKITQYGHGVCPKNGESCDCAPDAHTCAFEWETQTGSGTDSARFLAAGAARSFWLRTKQGFLAEGLPILREALARSTSERLRISQDEKYGGRPAGLIVESNSLLQFVKPALYVCVLDPSREDFKPTALAALDRADALVFRSSSGAGEGPLASAWMNVPARFLREKPSVIQSEGAPLPEPLAVLIGRTLQQPPTVSI